MATTGQDRCSTFSHPKNIKHLLPGVGSSTRGTLGVLVGRVLGLSSSSSLGRTTPWKTSSSVKERYHFTSSLSSITLSANNWGSPPAGRLFSSTQCWRALAYTTTFSQGISLISLHAYIDSASGINLCLQRHGRVGEPGGWPPSLLIPTSTVGGQRMLALPWPAFYNLLSLVLSTTWSTILGSHISQPSWDPLAEFQDCGLQRHPIGFLLGGVQQPSQKGGHHQL